MTHSQNAAFIGEPQGDEPDFPGEGLARRLEKELRELGYTTQPPDLWHGGWAFALTVGEAGLQVAIAPAADRKSWFLQVFVRSEPGFLARLFGKKPPNRDAEVHEAATRVHAILVGAGCASIRWAHGGPPDQATGTAEPRLPPQP